MPTYRNDYRRGFAGPRRAKDPKAALRRFASWARPFAPLLAFGALCTSGGVFLAQQPPRLFKYTIDTIIGEARYDELWPVIALFIGILIAGQAIDAVSRFWMTVAGQRLLHDLRMRVYDHLQTLPPAWYDTRQTGDLMARVTGDVRQVEALILHLSTAIIRQIFGMGFALYYMIRFSGLLTAFVLIPVPLITVGAILISRRMRVLYRAIRDATGELGARLQENLSGMRVIQAYQREHDEHVRMGDVSRKVMDRTVTATRTAMLYYPVLHLISASGTVIVLGAGTWLISRDMLTIGALTAFSMYIAHFYSPIRELLHTFDSVQRTLASGERIFEVLDTVPEVRDPDEPRALPPPRGEVEFRNVSFQYATGDPVLHTVSVHVAPGRRLALVGRSGAGKTSFVNLIPRFYDATDGTVLVDGVDVRDVRLADLRSRIAIVLQDTFLFDGTILENLRYSRPDADADAVHKAAATANALEFIERLPDGFETRIGERGIRLSGGQKQRLAIARAVLADPRILILDEATSSVDGESERLIHQALERLMAGRTTFVIAHRLSTVRNADSILVLDGGHMLEYGPHEDLYRSGGWYADMARRQIEDETGGTTR